MWRRVGGGLGCLRKGKGRRVPWTGQRLLGEYTGGYWKVIGGLGVEVAVDEDEGAELI